LICLLEFVLIIIFSSSHPFIFIQLTIFFKQSLIEIMIPQTLKKTLFLVLVFLLLFSDVKVFASGFNLKSISGVDTDGKLYSRWYHTDLTPTFSGEASGSEAVDIIIDGTAYQTAGNAADEWQFTVPTALSEGEHTVLLKSSGSEISFTLVSGTSNINWDEINKGGGETLPTVGFFLPTALLFSSGAGMVFLGRKAKKLKKSTMQR